MLFQFGCRPQSIHLREKNIVGSTERSEDANASSKLAEEHLRFSMKIMFAPAFDILLHSVRTVTSFPPPAKNFSLVFEIFENYGIIMQVICVGYSGT